MGLEGCDTTDSVLGVCVWGQAHSTQMAQTVYNYIPNQIWSNVLKTMTTTGSPQAQKLWLQSSWGLVQ